MLTASIREYSASVIAANTILRSLFAMAFPLFGRTMYIAMKPEWAGTLLGRPSSLVWIARQC